MFEPPKELCVAAIHSFLPIRNRKFVPAQISHDVANSSCCHFPTLAEEMMRAKQMLATMSHEIRSPLSGVVSMAEILSRTKLEREQRQLLNVMLSSGDLVLQLINDILDLSKVESGSIFPFRVAHSKPSVYCAFC